MRARLSAAIAAGRLAALASRALGRGGGTALPGLVAERVDPAIVAHLGRELAGGRVLVTGTNGKTTTSRLLASILAEAGRPVLYNREGSNLMRGVASTLLTAARLDGRLPHANRSFGLFEVDEATLRAAAEALAPGVLVFTNLFRDQLDRYGEVDTVAAMWREALASSPSDATLVLNADDPSVAELALDWRGPVHWFGLDDASLTTTSGGAVDARWCRRCGGSFAYDQRYFAHVGWWRCTGCGRERPATDTTGANVHLTLDRAECDVHALGRVNLSLTGEYNVYNALAAIAAARVLGIESPTIVAGLKAARAAFGRQEVATLAGRSVHLLLSKNPAGANQVLRLLARLESAETGKEGLYVAFLLNDRFADGQDVSWIWDVDYELLAGRVAGAWAGGTRAEDAALRLHYAGWPQPCAVLHDPSALLDAILADTAPGAHVFLIPTYTAMLDLRAELVRRGALAPFWK